MLSKIMPAQPVYKVSQPSYVYHNQVATSRREHVNDVSVTDNIRTPGMQNILLDDFANAAIAADASIKDKYLTALRD
jgi:hypothetical protein